IRGQAEEAAEVLDVGEVNVRLPNNGDGLSGSVDTGVPERQHVVNRREIGRTEAVVSSALIGVGEQGQGRSWTWLGTHRRPQYRRVRAPGEVVQGEDALHNSREGGGNRGIAGIGPVLFAIDRVLVDRSVKRLLHLAGRSGKFDRGSAFRESCDLKAARPQPRRDLLHVAVSGAEPRAELLGSKPLVVVGRRLVLLAVEKRAER